MIVLGGLHNHDIQNISNLISNEFDLKFRGYKFVKLYLISSPQNI